LLSKRSKQKNKLEFTDKSNTDFNTMYTREVEILTEMRGNKYIAQMHYECVQSKVRYLVFEFYDGDAKDVYEKY